MCEFYLTNKVDVMTIILIAISLWLDKMLEVAIYHQMEKRPCQYLFKFTDEKAETVK